MTVEELIKQLNRHPVNFEDVMETIDAHYDFTPTKFTNGEQVNEANTNNGSCKIFAFAKLNDLSEQATLNAFGNFYTVDVMQNPTGTDHGNIRNFIDSGWAGIQFETKALQPK